MRGGLDIIVSGDLSSVLETGRANSVIERTFTFPAEVKADGVRAKLGQGLLRVMVPKVKEMKIKARKVNVENVEGMETGLGA